MAASPTVSVSVVSHGQGDLMTSTVQDLTRRVREPLELILTLNILAKRLLNLHGAKSLELTLPISNVVII